MRARIDNSILEMALVGYNAKRDELVQKMAEIERQLGGRGKGPAVSGGAIPKAPGAGPKRTLSAAARKRIAAAQKKRWAVFHANKAGAAKPTKAAAKKPKRTLAPAVKARLVANLAKARAAKANKRAQAVGA